jgi:hypothetical protein
MRAFNFCFWHLPSINSPFPSSFFRRPLSDDNFFEKMRTGVSNNNKIYADKFENIDNLSNNNNNSPSIDLLNYSNNNVYADIVDLDDTETISLMYSQNAQQFDRGRHDRTLSNSSSRKANNDEQSFYLANSSVTSQRSFGSYRLHQPRSKNDEHYCCFTLF